MIPLEKTRTDARGMPVSQCDPQSLDDYETALYQFQSYFGDPTATLGKTLQRDPEFVMGHVFNASAMLMMSERQYLPMVREHIEQAEALAGKANDREIQLTGAARQWMEGDWEGASVTWDRVLADYPMDAMATQCAHLTDFYRGDAVNLRDRVGRVLARWDESAPGYSFILGMQAFGLEECNQFERAEETAMRALAMDPRDAWSVHAIAHVLEMQNRYEEGQAFMSNSRDDWAPDNGLAPHNWWHLALFHMEAEQFDTALELYDAQIMPGESDVSMQLLDASALLWRQHLQGVDCGERWNFLADQWRNKLPGETGYYAFNDLHAIIALLGDNQISEARLVLRDMEASVEGNPALPASMLTRVGIPASRALIAFAEARYGEVVDLLLPLRASANHFGGSNAQRDILAQTLIEAALRDRQFGLATNLVNERLVHKPFSPLSQRFKNKLG